MTRNYQLHLLLLGVFCISGSIYGEIINREETCLTDGTCSETYSNENLDNEKNLHNLETDEEEEDYNEYEDDDDEEEEEDYDEYEDDDEEEEEGEGYDEEWDDEEEWYDDEAEEEECIDDNEKCSIWANEGECETNPDYMLESCRLSCEACSDSVDYGTKQDIYTDGDETVSDLQRIIDEMIDYMENKVMVEEKYEIYREQCKNHDSKCAYWKHVGECEKSPKWMNTNCAPICQTCDELFICPTEPFSENIWGPGDLNKMFEKITTDEQFKKYKPQIMSRPVVPTEGTEINNNDNEKEKSSTNIQKETLLQDNEKNLKPKDGPWVVVLEEFVSNEECEALIEVGSNLGYKRSTVDSTDNADGTYEKTEAEYRTSSNAWCDSTCNENSLANNVIKKIEELTGVSELYSEYLQLLHYEEGQFYEEHHDYLEHQTDALEGPRILTVFLYLNDVEDGGGTKFNHLNMTVTPKRGRAVIWPSVLDEDPVAKEPSTNHEALAVIKGEKYGANAWIHLRDTKTGLDAGC